MKVYKFKTNINSQKAASLILKLLPYYYKIVAINYDHKKEKGTITITAKDLATDKVLSTIKDFGYRCRIVD